MNDKRFDLHFKEIEKLLGGYGQDLAMSGAKPREQRFSVLEVTPALIAIIGWFLRTILKVVIEHEVKKRLETKPVERELSDFDVRLRELEAKLRKLETIVDQATRREIPISAVKEKLSISYKEIMQRFEMLERIEFTFTEQHTDELIAVLQSIGLTHRKASRLSKEILDVSARFLSEAHSEDEKC